MIDPIMPPVGPPPAPLGPTPPEEPPLVTPQDVVCSSGVSSEELEELFGPNGQPALPPDNGITISEFRQVVSDAIVDLREALFATDISDALLFREFHGRAVTQAAFIVAIRTVIEDVANDTIELVNQLNTEILFQNTLIQQHNIEVPNDQSEIDALNAAITAYNNNPNPMTLQDYTDAAAVYNAYVNSRNPDIQTFNTATDAFNMLVDANNATIADLNIRREAIGLDPLDPQPYSGLGDELTLAPAMPPATEFPDVSEVNELVEYPDPPTAAELFDTEYKLLFEALFLLFSIIEANRIEAIENAIENELFFFRGVQPAFPDAFIANQPDTFFSTPSGASVGPAVAGTSLNLSSPSIEGLVSNSIFDAINVSNKQALDSGSIDEIKLQILSTLVDLALLSSLSASVLLGNQFALLGDDSPAITSAISLTLAARLQDLVSSNIFRNSNINLVRRNLGLGASFGRISGLADALTAGTNLALLQLSVSLISLALKTPGLATQLLGNVAGISTTDLFIASAPASQLNEVLRNPLAILFLKSTLSGQLALAGSLNTAQALVNLSINNVLSQGTFRNLTSLREALAGEFQAQGVGPVQSLALANAAVAQVNGDTNALFLDTAFISSSVNRGALAGALINRLAEQGFDVGTAGTIVNPAIELTLAQDFEIKREFRDQLSSDLVGNGLGRTNAIALANDAVEFLERGVITPFSADQIRQDILGASLTNILTGRGLGSSAAATTVDRIIAGAIAGAGAGGFRNAIRDAAKAVGFGPALARELGEGAAIVPEGRLGNPLLSLGATSILNLDSVSDLLYNEVEGQNGSEIGATEARKLADKYVDLLTNRNNQSSFVNLVERERGKLEALEDKRALEAFDKGLRDFVHMSPDTQLLLRRTEELGLTALSVPAQTAQGTGGPEVPINIMPV